MTQVDQVQRINAVLARMLMARMPEAGHYPTPIAGFVLHRRDISHIPENCFNKPILAVTVQGAKRTVVGNREFRYGAGQYLLAGVDMPSMSYLTEASPQKPYLVLSLDLDSHLIAQLMLELSAQASARPAGPTSTGPMSSDSTSSVPTSFGGTAVAPVDPQVLKACVRLMELLGTPEQIPVLAPLIVREIHLRLLLGSTGGLLKSINTQGSKSNQIFRGVNWLRENFAASLDVDELARRVHMAPPTFRKHFKSVTSMSPTQYHKHLRLYEAQRLMLEKGADVTSAGYAVGYESPTQFNREYKRLFGDPPARNVNSLR